MSVFHHDNIYLTWLNLKANNLSTLNYPYHGENISINNLIQLSSVEFNKDTPISWQGCSSQTLPLGPISHDFAWWYLQTANCPQAFRSSYSSSSRPFLSLHKERRLLLAHWTCRVLSSNVFVPPSKELPIMLVLPSERITTCNYRQHVWEQRKQPWNKHDPDLDPESSCPGHVCSLTSNPLHVYEALNLLRLSGDGGEKNSHSNWHRAVINDCEFSVSLPLRKGNKQFKKMTKARQDPHHQEGYNP